MDLDKKKERSGTPATPGPMSREDKKLQRIMETIKKMEERAEKKQRKEGNDPIKSAASTPSAKDKDRGSSVADDNAGSDAKQGTAVKTEGKRKNRPETGSPLLKSKKKPRGRPNNQATTPHFDNFFEGLPPTSAIPSIPRLPSKRPVDNFVVRPPLKKMLLQASKHLMDSKPAPESMAGDLHASEVSGSPAPGASSTNASNGPEAVSSAATKSSAVPQSEKDASPQPQGQSISWTTTTSSSAAGTALAGSSVVPPPVQVPSSQMETSPRSGVSNSGRTPYSIQYSPNTESNSKPVPESPPASLGRVQLSHSNPHGYGVLNQGSSAGAVQRQPSPQPGQKFPPPATGVLSHMAPGRGMAAGHTHAHGHQHGHGRFGRPAGGGFGNSLNGPSHRDRDRGRVSERWDRPARELTAAERMKQMGNEDLQGAKTDADEQSRGSWQRAAGR